MLFKHGFILGQWNQKDTLVEGYKVAIRSVQPRQGLHAEDGCIWSYDDSVIVVLGDTCPLSALNCLQ